MRSASASSAARAQAVLHHDHRGTQQRGEQDEDGDGPPELGGDEVVDHRHRQHQAITEKEHHARGPGVPVRLVLLGKRQDPQALAMACEQDAQGSAQALDHEEGVEEQGFVSAQLPGRAEREQRQPVARKPGERDDCDIGHRCATDRERAPQPDQRHRAVAASGLAIEGAKRRPCPQPQQAEHDQGDHHQRSELATDAT